MVASGALACSWANPGVVTNRRPRAVMKATRAVGSKIFIGAPPDFVGDPSVAALRAERFQSETPQPSCACRQRGVKQRIVARFLGIPACLFRPVAFPQHSNEDELRDPAGSDQDWSPVSRF